MKLLVVMALLASTTAVAEPPDKTDREPDDDPIELPTVFVDGEPKDLSRVGGSVHLVGKKALDAQQYDDPTAVLYTVPGVYIRQEDGYGLRPNIGLRGTDPERSKKVTLMEDGILFGPAPYAAPAAYYFPMLTRMVGVEVMKGPAAILYGPQTIGGAIDFRSLQVPDSGHIAFGDVAYGLHNYNKIHGYYGYGAVHWGVTVEAVHLMTDGFKELDGGETGDTGFNKQEVVVKARFNTDPLGDIFHRWDVRFGFSHETSNETYTGLTDGDFDANPDRRYAATALDQLNLLRYQAGLGYSLQTEAIDFRLRLYRADLSRDWRKLNGFKGGPGLASVLANPVGTNRVYYEYLTGAQAGTQALLIGSNDRRYVSQGAQADLAFRADTGPVAHDVRVGVRYHYDEVNRNHTEEEYDVAAGGALTHSGTPTVTTTKNVGSAHALAAFAQYAISGWGVTLKPGIRVEHIRTELSSEAINATAQALDGTDEQTAVLGGVGIHYEILPGLGVLAGVYQGFSPVAPGQKDDVDPEKSINYEAGIRYSVPESATLLEAIFFYTDYSNLLGTCTFSTGCTGTLGTQVNAGEMDVLGVEVVLAHEFVLPHELRLPVRATWTFTDATFGSDIRGNPEYGDANAGDEVPFLPPHQASLSVGIGGPQWGLNLQATYLDATRETAGQGDPADGEVSDRAVMFDANVHYKPLEWLTIYLKGENLLLQRPVVSRRPYGARPGKPFSILGGVKAQL